MGGLCSCFTNDTSKKIIMLGLDQSGKTTILYKLQLGDTMETIPTIGFNCEVVEYKDEKLSIWDVGGKKEVRVLWRSYFDHRPDALIFVVDAAVKERFEEAREFLHSVMADDRFASTSIPLLVFANKQDLPNAQAVEAVTKSLGLSRGVKRPWHVQGSEAVNGDGIYDGLAWLSKHIIVPVEKKQTATQQAAELAAQPVR